MANRYREVRLEELTDAVMFVMAGGALVDAETCRHAASHTYGDGEEVAGAALAFADKDAQDTVAVHVAEPDAQAVARRLLDLSLMKLRTEGVTTLRVQAGDDLAKALYADADWLRTLPTYDRTGHELDWLDALRRQRPAAAAVVDAALDKVAEQVGELAEQVEADAATESAEPPSTDTTTTSTATDTEDAVSEAEGKPGAVVDTVAEVDLDASSTTETAAPSDTGNQGAAPLEDDDHAGSEPDASAEAQSNTSDTDKAAPATPENPTPA